MLAIVIPRDGFVSGAVFSCEFWVDRFRFQIESSCSSACVALWQTGSSSYLRWSFIKIGCGSLPAAVSYYGQVFMKWSLASRVSCLAPNTFFSSGGFFCQSCGLTMRAADNWESARFTGFFLASSFFCPLQLSTQPAFHVPLP